MPVQCRNCGKSKESVDENDSWIFDTTGEEKQAVCGGCKPQAAFDGDTHGLDADAFESANSVPTRLDRPATPPYGDAEDTETHECVCGATFEYKSKLLHHKNKNDCESKENSCEKCKELSGVALQSHKESAHS